MLVVDSDPQGNMTLAMGREPLSEDALGLAHVLSETTKWGVSRFLDSFYAATWVAVLVCCSHVSAGVWYPSEEWGRLRL